MSLGNQIKFHTEVIKNLSKLVIPRVLDDNGVFNFGLKLTAIIESDNNLRSIWGFFDKEAYSHIPGFSESSNRVDLIQLHAKLVDALKEGGWVIDYDKAEKIFGSKDVEFLKNLLKESFLTVQMQGLNSRDTSYAARTAKNNQGKLSR